jgi:hypothetical protein
MIMDLEVGKYVRLLPQMIDVPRRIERETPDYKAHQNRNHENLNSHAWTLTRKCGAVAAKSGAGI